ncbi:MAG: hypothetical protein GWO41_09875 [candidate division Zixibacteria bacterium]|nr:hypothetical protein [candidate division Zixibacteria bacterium]NIT53026.1 hypothetical protein [candidate division Zixibacteria bacterium]NIW41268.1 hypothetical protein [candidate division Zixibacteria bacterium]NIX56617.1 hypothetical protein [candidate division Zixibacteria bacterium]
MQLNDWEKRLAAEANRVKDRTSTAVSNGNRNEDLRRKLSGDFLDSIGPILKESLSKFNELSENKIEFISLTKDRRGDRYCGAGFNSRQIRFVDSGRGFIRIDMVKNDAVNEVAFIIARLSQTGEFITWDEKNLLGIGNRLEPVTLQHVVRKYITLLVTS